MVLYYIVLNLIIRLYIRFSLGYLLLSHKIKQATLMLPVFLLLISEEKQLSYFHYQ